MYNIFFRKLLLNFENRGSILNGEENRLIKR